MTWFLLITAGILEVAGVAGMNMVSRKKNVLSWIVLIGGFGLSFLFLSIAMESIPMGTAYGVWTGIGTVGSALLGMIVYNEPRDAKRLLFISMIVVSVIGLKIVS
ncbi:DMT family transporter [Domibacillus enclensis]|uniref:Paired small multidrug resistance pump n=1 Tax=Domibacillus enclensis TaxID=1017273 RepID=A0A1N6WNB4_9BACI|nr:multidrug efflux SMR transporter [Domibacillus enclensis]OXS77991.1 QacE family quaternary ammonium compound efflux SMR transporter [Domibacillus enclensis]SIQ91583.1 paired small multidrug resistance pump [Domibacillus enclensis]